MENASHVMILCSKKDDDVKANETIERSGEYGSFSPFYGLVIAPAEDGRMKRVGWMFLQDEVGKNILDDKECWRDVSLV
jgi:hypothetical protein